MISVAQYPKNLNISVREFTKTIKGKTVESVSRRGKWLFTKLDHGYFLLINLGMGAELLHFKPNQKLPAFLGSSSEFLDFGL